MYLLMQPFVCCPTEGGEQRQEYIGALGLHGQAPLKVGLEDGQVMVQPRLVIQQCSVLTHKAYIKQE